MLQIELWKRALIWITVALGLLLALPNGFYSRVETHNDAVKALAEGGAKDQGLEAQAGMWPGWLPSGLVNLGLDLRGGAHLLAEVQVEDVYKSRIKGMWPEVRDLLRQERATIGTIRLQKGAEDELRIKISNADKVGEAAALVRGLARPVTSVTAAGATDLDVTTDGDMVVIRLSDAAKLAADDQTLRQSLEVVRSRIDEVGTREPTIQRQGAKRILIQVPGIGSAEELKTIIGTTAQLTFHPVLSRNASENTRPGAGRILVPSKDERNDDGSPVYYILEEAAVVTGEDLVDSQPAFDDNGGPAVGFRFGPSGARRFGDYTAENIGKPFAIVLDNKVISAPTIQAHIAGGSGIITGRFSIEEVNNLSALLRAGALPAKLIFVEERTIGPELGADSIEAGKIACIVAFIAVLFFLGASYGTFGIFANIALIINVGLIFGVLSLLGATLTLPGIAGIVLTIGMAVDANVLVFERIREELKTAKGPARAIELGYEKALSAIIDANITTMITAVILLVMGSGPVQGFAWTLGIGIMTSVFTAIFLTRLMVVMWFERKRPKTLDMTRRKLRLVPTDTAWDFFGRAKLWLGVSVLMAVVAVGSFGVQGMNLGIDFRGGTTIRTESSAPVVVEDYRKAIAPLGLGDVSITKVFVNPTDTDSTVAMIRIQAQEGEESVSVDTTNKVKAALAGIVPDITFPSVESVGPKVSGELVQAAIIAVVLAIGAVLIYIWLRFEWQFALGAVAALVHDVFLTVGIFSLVQIKFDLAIIAALLTIVGYSLNDTVVVFDRVRENLRKYKQMPLKQVLNLSINETLSRTVMTSVTTLLALIALFVLGGDVIRGFVFAMIWGVVVGTYSSVFVASAILLRLGVKRDWSKQSGAAGTQFADIDA